MNMDTIKEIDVKSVMTKSSLPVGGYSVNPYVGCPHACRYCYASFMKRFTGHTEPWGTFLDVKNWKPITNPHKYDGERVVIGSVTDGYNPYEEEFHRTRRLLEELRGSDAEIMICTKSDLVLRDLDLLKSFPKVTVSWSVNTLDEQFCADMDNAVSIERRLKAMRQTYEAGIRTVCFVSPIFPRITDVKAIMLRRIIAFLGDLSLCSRPHFAALRLLYLTLQATVQVAYLIINIIELQFSPCTFLLPIREIFIPFPGFSRYDVPFTNHFLSSFHCFFVGFPCFPLRTCIAIPLFHYATFCFRMSDLLNTSVSGDSSKTVRLELQFSPCTFLLPIREIFIPFPGFSRYDVPFTNHFLSSFHCFFVGFPCFPLRTCIAIPLFHYATFCFRMSDLLNTSVSGDSSKTVRLVIIVCT